MAKRTPRPRSRFRRLLRALALRLVVLVIAMRPVQQPAPAGQVSAWPETKEVLPIIQARCAGCHATSPPHPGFSAAPAGIVLEDVASINGNDLRVYQTAVVGKSMPLANTTAMTDEERELVELWYQGRQRKRDVHE